MKNKVIKVVFIVLSIFTVLFTLTACMPSKKADASIVPNYNKFAFYSGYNWTTFDYTHFAFARNSYNESAGEIQNTFWEVDCLVISRVNTSASRSYLNLGVITNVNQSKLYNIVFNISNTQGVELIKLTNNTDTPLYLQIPSFTNNENQYSLLLDVDLYGNFTGTDVILQLVVNSQFTSTVVSVYADYSDITGSQLLCFNMQKNSLIDLSKSYYMVDAELQYNNGYNSGYTAGFNTGYNTGIDDGNNYTFFSLISSVIDVPIRAFTSLFNFEVFGYNLTNFFLFLFSLAVVITIIRLIF